MGRRIVLPVEGRGSLGEHLRNTLQVRSMRSSGNRFVGSFVYELPWGRGKRFGSGWCGVTDALLGGWLAGTIMTLSSGTPATPSVRGNPANVGGGDRPDVVPGQDVNMPNQDPHRWWDPVAFNPNETHTFGDFCKGILTGPGRGQWTSRPTSNPAWARSTQCRST